jgi:hypothetical protein
MEEHIEKREFQALLIHSYACGGIPLGIAIDK